MTQSQLMMGWQLSKASLSENVNNAIQRYVEKYGLPSEILVEHNPSLQFKDVPLPVGMNIVLRAQRVVLPSMLLIGESNENSQMGLEAQTSDKVDMEGMTHEIQETQEMYQDT